MKAKAHQQVVAADLTERLQSFLAEYTPTKALNGTLDKLATQLAREQRQQAKQDAKAAAKAERQALAAELLTLLAPQFETVLGAEATPPKALTKTIRTLVKELTKQRKQQLKASLAAQAETATSPTAVRPRPARPVPFAKRKTVPARPSVPAATPDENTIS